MQGRRGQLFNLAVKRLCAGPVFFQMLSPALIRQPGNSREAALVASGDDIVLRQRSGGDNEIVRTDRRSIRRKLRREPGMDTGSNIIEKKELGAGPAGLRRKPLVCVAAPSWQRDAPREATRMR